MRPTCRRRTATCTRIYASVMEPWDGPAALAMTDGRWVVAGVDRNALRPLRTTLTADNLLIVGSETRHGRRARKHHHRQGPDRAGPDDRGRSRRGRLFSDTELKDRIAAEHPFGDYVKDFRELADLPVPPRASMARASSGPN